MPTEQQLPPGPRPEELLLLFFLFFCSFFVQLQYAQAREILRMLEAEAKTVEHSLSRVGYMKFTQKVR